MKKLLSILSAVAVVVGALELPITWRFIAYAQGATHFVTTDGSGSSDCSVGDPCTITRAVALINSSTINDGSIVDIGPGRYGQASLNITGSGSVGSLITLRADGDSWLNPGREALDTGTCSLTPTRTYTYQCTFDEAAKGFTPSNVSQNRPAVWVDVVAIDDNSAVTFEFTQPPKYKVQTSIAEVEAQFGSFFFDATANLIYIHKFHDSDPAPNANDGFLVNASSWGAMNIDGDYIRLQGLKWEQTGNLTLIDSSSNGSEVTDVQFISTNVTFQGTNTIIDGTEHRWGVVQGDPTQKDCVDGNAGFGVGECFGAGSTGTSVVMEGIGPQTIRNCLIEMAYNGLVAGENDAQTVEDCVFWGHMNHPLGLDGTNHVLRRTVVSYGQESYFSNQDAQPFGSLMVNFLMEYNLMMNVTLMWGPDNDNWTVRNNIFRTVRIDDPTETSMNTMDCNLYVTAASGVVMDLGNVEHNNLAAIQANTPFEDNGFVLPESSATDGSLWTFFTATSNPVFDFTPANALSKQINMPAPCGDFVGPYGEPSLPAAEGTLSRVRKRIR